MAEAVINSRLGMASSASYFLDLVSGRRRGFPATLILAVLAALAGPYRLAIAIRNKYFDLFRFAAQRVSRPVISIGNLTVGGTGKTPMAAKIANMLAARQLRVAILARGYKAVAVAFDDDSPEQAAARSVAAGDEAAVLRRRCPRARVYLNPDRVAAAGEAVADGAEVIVLDDGFQHRRMARDLEIVLIDATAPFGHGRMLPRGLLREPLAALRRADVVVLTRSNEADATAKADILRAISKASGGKPVAQASHKITGYLDVKGRPVAADPTSMQAILFAGIGNFQGFRRCVDRLGVRVLAAYEYPDHHYYSTEEIEGLVDVATTLEANVLLTTEKDAVKLVGRWNDERCRLLALHLEIEFDATGDRILTAALDRVLKNG